MKRIVLSICAIVVFVACNAVGTVTGKEYIPSKIEIVKNTHITHDGATKRIIYPEMYVIVLQDKNSLKMQTLYVPKEVYDNARVGENITISASYTQKPSPKIEYVNE